MSPGESLLIAAFGSGERAASAWREWARGRDFDALSADEARLLAPAYRNLREAGIADDEFPPIVKQTARSAFVRTRLLMQEAAALAALLEGNGIEPVLLKGAMLLASGIVSPMARPMSDFDLLVRREDARRAAALLESHGWRGERPVDDFALDFLHAVAFKRGESVCDLHWWAFWESRDAAGDERFRSAAQRVSFGERSLLVLSPEHFVLHTIVHGTRAYDPGAVRWIGDVLAMLSARAEAFDWPAFAREAEARGMAHPAGAALAYLVDTFGAAVPADVVQQLESQPVSRRQRRLYTPRGSSRHRSVMFLHALVDAAWAARRRGWLIRNLQHTLRARTLLHLPAALARKALQVVTSVISSSKN